MKDGIDPKDLAARLKAASPSERQELTSNYIAWIFRGARAQGWRGGVGMIVLGLSAFVALESAIYGFRSVWIYVLAALGAAIGILLVRVAFRRERDWRREHPFRY
jgi:hypothetical protein